MTKEITKKAFALAEKEQREKQVEQVKNIVTKTLEKLEKAKKEKARVDEQIKYLKMDLNDLKEGRLDRIEERQEKDPEAKKASVIIIVKEKEVVREVTPWYWPYHITWTVPDPGYPLHPITCNDGTANFTDTSSSVTTINCSVAKNNSAGTYDVDGHIIHFR